MKLDQLSHGTDCAEPPDDDDDENNTDSNPLKITPVSEIVNGSEKLTIEDTTEASEMELRSYHDHQETVLVET